MTQSYEQDQVVWTENLSDRRLKDRRGGIDRRDMTGQAMHVPTLRAEYERRQDSRRETVTLVITGRAIHAGHASDDM